MPGVILLMIAAGLAYGFWNAAREAAERAVQVGRDACRAAGVQLLDESVHASGLRLRRRHDGRLGFERTFRFEYSHDGVERHIGRLALHAGELVHFSGPTAAADRLQ